MYGLTFMRKELRNATVENVSQLTEPNRFLYIFGLLR